ncbi:hypothetical protein BC835DRAFT_1363193 [Cytidiella melzeri]|nr:hypothetical protein BC835DRAFT_1363193 [Cytidiella melzeri]
MRTCELPSLSQTSSNSETAANHMLNLINLRLLLAQTLSTGGVQTATLFTPEGQLISFASEPPRSKDEVRVLVGLSSEIWQEARDQGMGMADSELGRILVVPAEQSRKTSVGHDEDDEPLLLLAVNAPGSVSWDLLEAKAQQVVQHLDKPVSELRGKLVNTFTSPVTSPRRPTR